MFKKIRIFFLLVVLASVAAGTWRTRMNSVKWEYALPVNVYPVNADGSAVTQAYLQTLTRDDFKPIESFMQSQAARYGRDSKASVELRLGQALASIPPQAPVGGAMLEVVLWSLKMRWWAYRHGDTTGPGPQVKMYLLYYDPAYTHRLDHSTALQKGLIGRVNVFASAEMAQQNNIVIAHEFLHTLGATDKYDVSTNQPIFPIGYAEPQREPLLPQEFAEIMGGRIPVTRTDTQAPTGLSRTVIGEITALEIHWLSAAP